MASRSPRWQRSLLRAQPARPRQRSPSPPAPWTIRSRSISRAARTTSRPSRSPICAPASRRTTRTFSAAISNGKVVLIGTLLDVEDRKITSKRFATAPEGARAERCALTTPAREQTFGPRVDIRRVRPGDGGEQSASWRRADRIRPHRHRHRVVRAGRARGRGRAGARARRCRACLPWYCGNLDCGRDGCVSRRAGGTAGRASGDRARCARRHDRLSPRRRRPPDGRGDRPKARARG